MEYTLARSRYIFDEQEAYMATAYSVRDRLIESWNDTQTYFKCAGAGGWGCWVGEVGLVLLGWRWTPSVGTPCP